MLLLSLLLIPMFGAITIIMSREFAISLTSVKVIAASSSILNFFISLVIFILFDFSTNQFQLVQEYHEISYYDLYLGVDGLSIYFILLTTIITPIALVSNWKSISKDVQAYVAIILILESLLLAVFLVLDILLFYIFFESILPPLFILIGMFGADNRVKASFYLFLYTLLGSLFLLLSILAMSSIMSTTDFDTLFKGNFLYITQLFLFYGIFIAFAVKTPTMFLNTWLLKAHVESPLAGSIVLAAIVLKLSLYGILRLILPILTKAYVVYTYIIFLIAVITIVYASLSTLRTIDIKELIAYSSVSHAAVYLAGVFSNTIQGIEGAIALGLGHGFVSPGLFICAGGVLYDRAHTRVISFYRGLTQVMPLFAILFFILCLANCGAPLTLNFVGEFLSLYGVFERSPLYGLFSSSSIIFSAAYTIYMFQRIAFGGAYSKMLTVVMPDLTKREFSNLMLLTVPTVMLGIYPSIILDGLAYGVSLLLYNSDILFAASSLPLSDAGKEALKESDNFVTNAAREVSSINEMRRASADNKEILSSNVEKEEEVLKKTYSDLNSKLETAKNENPSHSDTFEEHMYIVKDAYDTAKNVLQETKETAMDLIDDNSSDAVLFIVGQGILAESLLGPFFVFVSTALKLYSNKPFRYIFKVWLSVIMANLTKIKLTVLMLLIVFTTILVIYPGLLLYGLGYALSLLSGFDPNILEFFTPTFVLNRAHPPRIESSEESDEEMGEQSDEEMGEQSGEESGEQSGEESGEQSGEESGEQSGEQFEYLLSKGNSGNKSVDECPWSVGENNEHKLAESSPANLSETDPTTADCKNCEKVMENATETYNTCISCDSSFCNTCFTEVFLENDSSSAIICLLSMDAAVLPVLLTLYKLYKLKFFYMLSLYFKK